MSIPHWILLLAFLHAENGLCQHIRHERTRYMSGRNQLYASGYNPNEDEVNENELPIVNFWKRPLQTLENSMIAPKKLISRPLFSWDLPEQITVNEVPKEFSSTPNSMVPPFEASTTSRILTNDVTYPPKTFPESRRSSPKDFAAFRSSYRFLTSSSSSRTKNKKSIEAKPKSKKREEQSTITRTETTTNETRRKKKSRRKNINRKPTSSAYRTGSETKSNLLVEHSIYQTVRTNDSKFLATKVRLATPPSDDVSCGHMEPKCEHFCRNVNGTARCVCFKGFAPAGNKCVDINECEVNNGNCNGRCINTLGSRKCVCSSGYRLENVCVDINECLLRNGHGPCQDRCINTPGSYHCTCDSIPGTKLSSDGHTCEPSNGCEPQVHGCSHSCVNFSRRAFCLCPDGLELSDDWKTCRDVDECSNPDDYNVKCTSTCINTVGSYYCSTLNGTTNSLNGDNP